MKRYRKSQDAEILLEIKNILKKRPTYGYKRVTAMLNQKQRLKGLPVFNRKRVYRIMSMNGLVLPKSIGRERKHAPTGKVITLHSNTRWCSDCFEIKCFNGEKVYVGFTLDCHDRECLAVVSSKEPLNSIDMQELMLKGVESRFSSRRAPREIEYLSDRGSIYRAKDTVQFARLLGLKSCFTAAYSPESNGMAEAFVKTFKRDYVYVSDCYDAATVMKLIEGWIKDYNEMAPHSGLGMKSPLQYRNSTNLGV